MQLLKLITMAPLLVGCTTEPLFNFAVRGSLSPDGDRGTGAVELLDVPIFSFYVGSNADCSTPQVVIDYGSDPLVKDFASEPTLFSGKLSPATYPCAILQVGDVLTFNPDVEAQGAHPECSTESAESDGYLASAGTPWKDLAGNEVSPQGTVTSPSAAIVTLFFTTDPAALKAARNLADDQVVELVEEFTVPGEITLFFDLADRVTGTAGACVLEDPFSALGMR